jgi:predicted nucleic acid-binding protein
MIVAPVVSNASPIIALIQIEQLHLLEQLFGTVVIPYAVVREISPTTSPPSWIEQQPITQALSAAILDASLGAGESETISLALETHARLVILDDRPARRLAQSLGLTVIGTLGILLVAKQRQLIATVQPSLDALLQHDFRISQRLYEQVLLDAQERM